MQMRRNYFDGQHQQHFISVIPDKTRCEFKSIHTGTQLPNHACSAC